MPRLYTARGRRCGSQQLNRQPTQSDKGHLFARKGDKALNIDITEHKGGNAGRVTGSVLDSSR